MGDEADWWNLRPSKLMHALRTQLGFLSALIDMHGITRCACIDVRLFWHGGLSTLWVMIRRGSHLIHGRILHSSFSGVRSRLVVCDSFRVPFFQGGMCVSSYSFGISNSRHSSLSFSIREDVL